MIFIETFKLRFAFIAAIVIFSLCRAKLQNEYAETDNVPLETYQEEVSHFEPDFDSQETSFARGR